MTIIYIEIGVRMMNKLKRRCLTLCLAGIILASSFFSLPASAETAQKGVDVKAESAMLLDADSGKILYENNADKMLYPASMTKMMTEYLVLDAIKSGKITWGQKTSISDYVFKISHNRNLSNVYLRQDEQYTVRELYESMAIYSANASAIALAEVVAGSETAFVKMMNEKASSLGMKNFKFVNCTGLNNSDLQGMQPEGTGKTDENMMSARTVATLAFRLLKDHPEVLQTSSIPSKVFREGTSDRIKMSNWNFMLPGLVFGYKGVDGLKTGSTAAGGYSFTCTAKRDNMRLISVVMKVQYPGALGRDGRFKETKKLLDYGFGNFSKVQIIPSGYTIPGKSEIPVANGRKSKIGYTVQKPLSIVVKKGEEKLYEPEYVLDSAKQSGASLTAPIKKDETIGALKLNYKGSAKYTYLTSAGESLERVNIVATSAVKKANWLILVFKNLGRLLSNLFKKIF